MKKLFNDKIILMKDSELKELIELIDIEKEHNNYLINKNWNQRKEIERLNNIINTFEEYLENVKMNLRYSGVKWDDDCLIRAEVIQQVLHKLKELKESGNNE